MRVRLLLTGLVLGFFIQADLVASDPNRWMPAKDTIKFSRDSLMKIIQIKDSMLLQASLDSLALSELLEMIWWEKDSLQAELQNLHFALRQDSLYSRKRDSVLRELNRLARWQLRDSIFMIEQDSVKKHLFDLITAVYSDSSRIPDHGSMKETWKSLIYHLGNDSTFFWIHYADRDSIQVVLKNEEQVTAAIFLTNEKADSAKVYLRGGGKHSLHMYLDEGVFLTHALKRSFLPKELDFPDLVIQKPRNLAKKKPPQPLPKHWNFDSWVKMTINQIAFSNWARSGDNQLTFGFESKGFANYHKGKMSWNSDYWYRYGTIKQQGQDLHKNLDLLKANSKYLHAAFKNFSYSANISFDGQMFKGFRSPGDSVAVSKFMSPASVILGIGMEYKPSKSFSANLQPVSQKFTFVLDTVMVNPDKFKIPEGKRVFGEPGATLTIGYKTVLWKNISMDNNLRLFSSYFNNPEKIDVDFTTRLSLMVNKYVSTSLFLHAIYDDDILIPLYEWVDGVKTQVGEGKRVQLQEQFGIVLTYFL